MEPADPYQAPRTSDWLDEEPTSLDGGRSARWVGRLGALYLVSVCVAGVVVVGTRINWASGPPLIPGFPRWSLARCVLVGLAALGWALSVATYRMQVAQGRPLYAGVSALLGFLSGGLLLIPILAFGPTSPGRSSSARIT